jgi:gamma-glutamyl-gamma-aminobutyrate hydrolase PuuD
MSDMNRPVIGILSDRAADADRLHCQQNYITAVEQADGVALILPYQCDAVGQYLGICAGFVLAGGDDPDTRPFGQPIHPKARLTHPARQQFELALLEALDHAPHPVLGICLGMQMMALHHGGTIDQHLGDSLQPPAAHRHRDGEHPIRSLVDGHGLLPPAGRVRSHHHQAVTHPGRMRSVAESDDRVIEAVDLPGRPGMYLGVQWHPERSVEPALGQHLFDRLVQQSARSTRR